ncbi:hypothetical protein C1752_10381 [Acaryochloris thomasi RCC1774]|uniref:Uncharacterized protein n=1 Tax=Acaryochloris thomasi RCC1774 TaxID=1764569 RepID=A0A2W1J8L7_9CYAN|nr:hypothetical protein [Acaryochloris thomasi]PZD70660.1 hypothetical protein C1752_10381 [Acaryochloris thomasi RCC1774]
MPRKANEKCRRCAKQGVDVAKAKECWVGQKCHVRRASYRRRDRRNRERRDLYAVETGKVIPEQTVEPPIKPAAYRYFYRERVDAPVHAIQFDLWVGQERVRIEEPVHTLGWKKADVTRHSLRVLKSFSGDLVGGVLLQFEDEMDIHPSECPVRPCPLCP